MKTAITRSFIFFMLFMGLHNHNIFAKDTSVNPKAKKLLNDFMQTLLIEDSNKSAKALVPLVHKSVLNGNEDNLVRNVLEYSFKKAHNAAKLYEYPVKITRVRQTNISAIGFGPDAEAGSVYDYFIDKKKGINGLPAPVQVFFPKDGGPPKISYMGSL